MAAMQGDGKVRLIAKKGLFQEDGSAARMRQLVLNQAIRNNLAKGGVAVGPNNFENDMKDAFNAITTNYFVEFDVTPDITESGSVSYFEASDIRGPASILMYMGSPSRTFSISAKLVSRTPAEAARNQKYIHTLKSWRMPESYVGGINAGTPTLLYLQGYGKMFKDIPVVMTDLSIELSSEHDFIGAGVSSFTGTEILKQNVINEDGTSFNIIQQKATAAKTYKSFVPIITPVSITLKEAHSVEGDLDGLEGFDILKYRNGELVNW